MVQIDSTHKNLRTWIWIFISEFLRHLCKDYSAADTRTEKYGKVWAKVSNFNVKSELKVKVIVLLNCVFWLNWSETQCKKVRGYLLEDEGGNWRGAGKLILLHKVRQRNASHDHGKNMKKLLSASVLFLQLFPGWLAV